MCYSAQASFLTAATLAPISVSCLNSAFRRHRKIWPLATIPMVFGIQQAMEGLIWTSLDHHHPQEAEMAAKVYLFFAMAWWPFWGPLTAFVASETKWRKAVFGAWTILSTGWFFLAYLPCLIDSRSKIQATVVHHSIRYTFSDEMIVDYNNRIPVTILYVIFSAVPLILSTPRSRSYIPMTILFISIVVANYFYSHAYTSVWCISAAIISSYCLVYFRGLDRVYSQSSVQDGQLPNFLS